MRVALQVWRISYQDLRQKLQNLSVTLSRTICYINLKSNDNELSNFVSIFVDFEGLKILISISA
jgi:hypothetical protein